MESMNKIFSLQTKTHLLAWSVIFGFIITLALYCLSFRQVTNTDDCRPTETIYCLSSAYEFERPLDYGWPFKFHGYSLPYDPSTSASYIIITQYSFVFNMLFWILVVYGVLHLAKHFRNKDNKITSSQN